MNYDLPLSIGIDAGNTSIKIAVCDKNNKIIYSDYKIHQSRIDDCYNQIISAIPESVVEKISYGSASGIFAGLIFGSIENSIESLVKGVKAICPNAASVVEMGSHNSQYITGLQNGNIQFSANKNCAAGTGSFFEDQMTRLGAKIEDYSDYVLKATSIPRIAGRCSVFAKTDIIHRQQDGEKIENILKGLTYSMVANFKGTIMSKLPLEAPIFLAGGCSKNIGVIMAFEDLLHLDKDFIVCPESSVAQAVGTAILAKEKQLSWKKTDIKNKKETNISNSISDNELPNLIDDYPTENLHQVYQFVPGEPVFLGIDVGSTSTNFVLVNQKNQVLDYQYFKTLGDSAAAVERGFESLKQRFGDKLNVKHSGVTGSGRIAIGKKFNIPVVKDEITAQSTGTLFLNPECDTIFEIGGQDAKYIKCENGKTIDFTMNKVCSAGTGSFIEDQAERLGITAYELGMKAFESKNPSNLDQRCTVFMKTSIENQLVQGDSLENICAGVCYSVVKNYINKVVSGKTIGKKICFQGGLAYNHGIVAVFKKMFGDRFAITPYFSVTGALGMALLAKESFNQAKEKRVDNAIVELNKQLFENIQKTTFGMYSEDFEPSKKTVGIPRSMMIYKLFPFAYNYFKELGFNVVLSQRTDEDIVRISQNLVKEETCFPIKLMHGHMQELVEAGVDYIFMPSVYTMQHALSNLKHNYGCVYMQSAARLVADVLRFEEKGIKLLNPVLQMDMGAPHMAFAMIKIGLRLGKNPIQCKNALLKSGKALKMAQKIQEEDGKNLLERISENEKVLVLITRTYGLIDDVLNMGLPNLLLERGCTVITLGNLEGHEVDISKDYKNLYWPFSQHILSGAKIIKDNPNLYAVYLTNHGCGPDTMINHLFAEIMGKKPYLQIEVDEHYSKTGLITRIEAFLSNLEKNENKIYKDDLAHGFLSDDLDELDKSLAIYIPHYDFISSKVCSQLKNLGYNAKLLEPTSRKSLTLGKDCTTSKEYVTFASLLGDVLLFEKENPKSEEIKQLLLFQTEGSETDGFYATVIRSKLDSLGRSDIHIIAPKIEQIIYQKKEIFDIFWNAVCYVDEMFEKNGSIKNQNTKTLYITGNPQIILNQICNSNFFDYLKQKGVNFKCHSFKEYYLFMWMEKIRQEKDTSPEIKRRLKKLMKDNIGTKIKNLQKIADKKVKLLTGTNLRYRYAARTIFHKGCDAIIELVPMYENGTSILNMMKEEKKGKLPLFQMQFDGKENKDDFEMLDSFMELIKK
ncbi:acyl-CoA dehydratase activase [Treponema pectinovorum]|uniref:acyl-CoA dehydratase activase n=1 Tax=Treponema pectinovorum TaxID=164 RepID=UPI0011CA9080|nr:acyl-CoA dehydratase activase [Treponema pectinovorum]